MRAPRLLELAFVSGVTTPISRTLAMRFYCLPGGPGASLTGRGNDPKCELLLLQDKQGDIETLPVEKL